ncbi:MAG: phosphatidate cytidylyltransferase [Clostridia bacterium]|nr:phosphatidate cytidylyltransferase [Clostridia bacterium]
MTELTLRVLTVLVGLPIVLAAVYVGGWAVTALAAAASVLAAIEFQPAARAAWGAYWPLPGILAGLAVVLASGRFGLEGWRDAVVASLLGLAAWAVLRGARRGPEPALRAWSATTAYVLTAPALYAFMPLLRSHGRPALLWPLAVVWVGDAVAYFAGRAFGRRPLAAELSPGKSWEGFLCGLVAAAAAGYGFAWLAGLDPVATAWQSGLLSVAGLFGDLFESAFKRTAGAKDSGRLLPGHGGVWDRFDSLAFALPVALWFEGTWPS